MKRLTLTLVLLLYLIVTASAHADTGVTDVTNNNTIQNDLALAETYWLIEQPNLVAPPCGPEQVIVTPLSPGVDAEGIVLSPGAIWAETYLNSCTIMLSPTFWPLVLILETDTQTDACLLIAHEYGHTLGLPDTESNRMMSDEWYKADDPLCDQYVYGWKNTLHKDREWLAAHGLAERHMRGVAP